MSALERLEVLSAMADTGGNEARATSKDATVYSKVVVEGVAGIQRRTTFGDGNFLMPLQLFHMVPMAASCQLCTLDT